MEKRTIYTCVIVSVFIIFCVLAAVLFPYYYVIYSSGTSENCLKIVIDHDGGADDAMAIFLTLLYEKYFDGPKVVGLTTSHGNINESQVYINSQRILDIADRRDVPIYRGTNSSLIFTYESDFYFGFDGLGDLENVSYTAIEAQSLHAAISLIELSKKYEGEIEVVAIGALTNIALAINLDPHFISRLRHLYVAAGNVQGEPEFNAQIDAEAYYIAANHATPDKVTFIPFSYFYENNITMEWRNNVLGSINTTIMQNQNQFERISNAGIVTWNLLDPQALALVLNKSLIDKNICTKNSIILCGENRAVNTNDFVNCSEANANLAQPVKEDEFKSFLYDVFSADTNLVSN